MRKRKRKAWRRWLTVLVFLAALFGIWKAARSGAELPGDLMTEYREAPYSDNEKAMKAVAASYFVYGCEQAGTMEGTVGSLLDANRMGIVAENFGILRTDEEDPATALIDTAGFIREQAGQWRFLADKKSGASGFYGAALCDDANRCVWIAFAGSVTFRDAVACAAFVTVPGLSPQEKEAAELMRAVLGSTEVGEQGYAVILTGHSLGGALAAELSLLSGCEAVTVNGADGLALSKLGGITGETAKDNRISNYMTSPRKNDMSLMAFVQRLMFLGSWKSLDLHLYPQNAYSADPHCAFSFVEYTDGMYALPAE